MTEVHLGFFPNGSGAYPEIAPVVAFERLADAGYTSVDLQAHAGVRDGTDSRGYPPDARRAIRSAAERCGLGIAAIVTSPGLLDSARRGTPLDLTSAVRLASDVGAAFVTVHVMTPTATVVDPGSGRRDAIDAIGEAARAAAGRDVAILVDALVPGSFLGSPRGVAAFLADIGEPNVGWNADPAFLHVAGLDVPGSLIALGPWIRHVHLKGTRGRWPDVEWLLPGDGNLDLTAAIGALAAIGYQGAVTAEPVARPRGHRGGPRWSFEEAVDRSQRALAAHLRVHPATIEAPS